jgi:DNA-binding NarL/FixJ family response regulator
MAMKQAPGSQETRVNGSPQSASGLNGVAKRRRILVIDDHPVVSLGMKQLIGFQADLQLCGTACDRASAINQVGVLRPDLVILDLYLRERSGLDLLKEIKTRFPKQRVLILSLYDELVYAARAIRAGASGYVMKAAPTEMLLTAVRQVLNGGTYVSQRLEKNCSEDASATPPEFYALRALSDRELEVFRLIGLGKTTQEIARLFSVTQKTVESHRTHVRQKLHLTSATELIQLAIRLNDAPGG